jgi:cystathionine beta-lyase/cystathionine gamma-synthase
MSGGFGGMLAFDVAGGKPAARAFVEGLELVRLATSLGSVETTADLPAITSHAPAMIDPASRERLGIRESTVRLSVGCEDADDLIADLSSALERSRQAASERSTETASERAEATASERSGNVSTEAARSVR